MAYVDGPKIGSAGARCFGLGGVPRNTPVPYISYNAECDRCRSNELYAQKLAPPVSPFKLIQGNLKCTVLIQSVEAKQLKNIIIIHILKTPYVS